MTLALTKITSNDAIRVLAEQLGCFADVRALQMAIAAEHIRGVLHSNVSRALDFDASPAVHTTRLLTGTRKSLELLWPRSVLAGPAGQGDSAQLALPAEQPAATQAVALASLQRLLELDGFSCTTVSDVGGVSVPLLVEKNGRKAAIGLQSGLLSGAWNDHSLRAPALGRGMAVEVLNEYILRRNLPDEHQLIRNRF